ncbi:EamA family transporter [Microbacterium sp. zg.B48]|uniref:EamA family transporter n=1 Tax=unclassified Microbacterium TaxID=2609290 RepID=UPI00214BD0C4|nr:MULTISPECIES: EamA family transporter [unclassified Microbacterium]MCR2762809.1 EamA family transporter [Microbacterium sp. zg.B48]MCR2808367.1 EamA family transporter [Microbacterium sp. zg.B185]WIM20929.1 EamA family transporter [Microbacterium sp. zg-B185]
MTSRAGTTPAVVLVLVGLACQEVGASLAMLLFPQVGPLGMVMLRLVFSAALLLLIARPGLRGHSRDGWLAVVGFGVVLAVMNGLFYLALERLPLGVTVTIEVLGPLVLSIVASRRLSAWLWALLALLGVVALGGGGWERLDPIGVIFALGAAASWVFYILGSARVGREFPKLDGLALAMTVGALIALPFGIASAGTALLRPDLLALGAAVAILSSTIPYAFELIALRRLPAAAFAILMSLAPATASLAGWLLLGQELVWLEILGIALVIAASIGAVRSSSRAGRAAASARDAAADRSDRLSDRNPGREPETPFAEPLA